MMHLICCSNKQSACLHVPQVSKQHVSCAQTWWQLKAAGMMASCAYGVSSVLLCGSAQAVTCHACCTGGMSFPGLHLQAKHGAPDKLTSAGC